MKALFKKEFLDVLRDKRTIINMIIIPVFGIPFLMFFMGGIMSRSIKELGEKKYKIGVYEKVEFKEVRDILRCLNFEILLSSPAGVNRIIISKILVVTVVAFIAAILTTISLSITLSKGGFLMGVGISKFQIFKSINIKEILLIFSIIIPFSFLVSSIEIAITSYARSYKEAQSLLTPLTFAGVILAFYSFVPSISFSSYHSLIPVLNIAVTIKKILQGEFVLIEYLITFGSNIFYMLIAFIYSVNTFKKEKIIFRV